MGRLKPREVLREMKLQYGSFFEQNSAQDS